MDNLSIIENIKGTKVKMQYYGPHCFDAEGKVMPFGLQMAVVSHYLHNKDYATDKTYKEKALGLMEDMYRSMEEKKGEKNVVAEEAFQMNLFKELFDVPFLPLIC